MIATPTFPDLAALVVDESLYIRRILRDMLTRVGIKRVLEAPDGAEALGVLSESKPDLVILDWDPPPRDPLGRGVHPPDAHPHHLAGAEHPDHRDDGQAAALCRRSGHVAGRQ